MDRPDLIPEILHRLEAEFHFRRQGDHLRKGECPNCGKRELWTWTEKPFHIQCARMNNCGWESGIKTLYPELFTQFNRRYPPTEADPHATAHAYVRYARGFDPARLEGFYTQGSYYHPHADQGTATVRFSLADGVCWEKLIDPVTLTDSATGAKDRRSENFIGKYKGLAWMPPGMEITPFSTVYWAEGIFDAVALWLAGKPAIAIMSCASFPETFLAPYLGQGIRWVLALDPDKAGRAAARKHLARLADMGEQTGCILPGEGVEKIDWNDRWQRGELEDPDAWKAYEYYGALFTAANREEKARQIYRYKGLNQFCFEFGSRTHAFKLDIDKYNKAIQAAEELSLPDEAAKLKYALEQSGTVKTIATCALEFRYVEQDEITGDKRNFFNVRFPNGHPDINIGLPGNSLTSSSRFKDDLASKAPGALWEGTGGHLDELYKGWFYRAHKTIQSVGYTGYVPEFHAYLFQDFAVRDGKLVDINADDYFDFGKAGNIKSNGSVKLTLSRDIHLDWIKDFQTAFGQRGMVALAYLVGTLLACQIRDARESYPFLELYGERGSGKSRLIEFLWKCCGRKNYEGFNPNISSMIGVSRELAQVSNLMVCMTEANHYEDRPHCKAVNWENYLTLYDGNIGRSTGVKSSDNRTKWDPFRGALVMVQNTPIDASEAFVSRLIRIRFDRAGHSNEGREAVARLNALDISRLSGFVLAVLSHEKALLAEFLARADEYEKSLVDRVGINDSRIAKNHAQIMALVWCLKLIFPLREDDIDQTHVFVQRLALELQESLAADCPTLQRFWDTFDYLDRAAGTDDRGRATEIDGLMNHSRSPEKEISINLEHFQEACEKHRQEPFSSKELRNLFPTSRRYKFVEKRAQNSRITGTTIRCWVFSKR